MEIEDECKAYIESFNKWKESKVEVVGFTEVILHDDAYRFTGRIDMIVKLKDGNMASVILKTGREYKSWNIQLAASKRLCDVNLLGIQKNLIVQLSKDGKEAKEIENDFPEFYWNVFHSTLKAWHYFKGEENVSSNQL